MTAIRGDNQRVPVWLGALSLWRREMVRFLRQRSRVVGALGTPLVFWVVIGSGLGRSFAPANADEAGAGTVHYLEYFFPGALVLVLLFTAIFSTISLIEDRREGFMQAVIASSVPRSAIVLGKVLGSTTLAVAQAMIFLLFAPAAGLRLGALTVLVLLGVLLLVAVSLSALGFVIAWPMESTQGFHAIMNLLLMPMWLLSGAVFPTGGASAWVSWIMALNPLSYGLAAVRGALYTGAGPSPVAIPPMGLSLGVTAIFGALMLWACVYLVTRRR